MFGHSFCLQWCFWSGQTSIDYYYHYITFLSFQDWNRGLWGSGHLKYHLQHDHHVPQKHLNGAAHRPLHLLHQLPHAAHLLVWPQRRPGRGGESRRLHTSAHLPLSFWAFKCLFDWLIQLRLWFSRSPADACLCQLDKDDMVYMEAYDKLLESWLTLIQDDEHFPRGCFVQPAIQVFNSYIQCHLAAPDGTRNLVSLCQLVHSHPCQAACYHVARDAPVWSFYIKKNKVDPHFPYINSFNTLCTPLLSSQSVNGITSHEEEEINELQEDDRELFSDQLSSIGMMGRVAADHCIPLLTRLHACTPHTHTSMH